MISLLLVATFVAAPPWATDLHAAPAIDLKLAGPSAPAGVLHVPPTRTVKLKLQGPVTVTVRLFGLLDRRKGRLHGPGFAVVTLDKSKPTKVVLSKTRMRAWKVTTRRWLPTAERSLALSIPAGTHTLRVATSKSAVVGAGLLVGTSSAASTDFYEPPLPSDSIEEPALPSGPFEPPLPDDAFEPALPLLAPATRSEALDVEHMTVIGKPPPIHVLTSPIGSERFLSITVDNGLHLGVSGPGLLKLAIHAHRAEANVESMRPVIVSLLLDEVLTQAVSIDQPASPEYRVQGAAYVPSLRVNVRLPIPHGRHRVRITLSDSAVLGASVLPLYESLTKVDEPGLLTSEAARRADLRAARIPEISGTAGIAVLGAAWVPSSMQHAGFVTQLEGTLGIPVAGPRLSVGLSGGFGRAEDPRRYADQRLPAGASRVNLVVTHVPIVADARWSAPIPPPFGVEAGVGGGVLLLWPNVSSRGTRTSDGLQLAAIGWVHVTLLVKLGPGALVARAAYIAGAPVDTARLRDFDPGGALGALGYRLTLIE